MSSVINVLIVDDSAVARQVLAASLNAASGIAVRHAVANAQLALERMKLQWPDVIVLDPEATRTEGMVFLRRVMALRPTPVVVCTAPGPDGQGGLGAEALAAGAVAVVAKPAVDLRQLVSDSVDELVAAVRVAAAGARPARTAQRSASPSSPAQFPPPLPLSSLSPSPAPPLSSPLSSSLSWASSSPAAALLASSPSQSPASQPSALPDKLNADAVLPPGDYRPVTAATERVVMIGASTGGTEALETVLAALPPDAPGIVVVQHMPEKFMAAFAARLDSVCAVRVKEAADNDPVLAGQVLIAPGNKHVLLRRSGVQYFVDVVDGPLVNRHRPSVDVLFRSAARAAGLNALGVIMTGMGDDGAAGMLEMREAGARTVAQDEASCVVYGMPKEAVKRGGVDKSVPLSAIHREILLHLAAG